MVTAAQPAVKTADVQTASAPAPAVTAAAPRAQKTSSQSAQESPMFSNTPKAYFAFNKYVLTDTSKETLDAVAKKLQNAGDVDILIIGHTDSAGTLEYNQKLSEKRAKEVYDYLVNKGVKVHSMRYYGMGKTQPVANNATAKGRAKNRRVEVIELQVPSI
jgi:OOP family OmpA-OmpF porin